MLLLRYCLLWLFVLSQAHAQADTLVISDLKISYDLVPHLSYICEQENQTAFTASNIAQQTFQPINSHSVAFSYRNPPCWFKFQLNNPSQHLQQLILDIPFSLLDHIELFTINDKQMLVEQYQSGDNIDYYLRPIAINNPAFHITLPTLTTHNYYLRIQTTSPFSLPIYLYTVDDFILHQSNYELAIGIFYGVAIGLLFYNFALWYLTRERSQLLYVFYLSSSIIYFLWLHGILFRLWPHATNWNNHGFYASILLMVITGLFFVRYYLQLAARPLLNKSYYVFITITFSLLLIQFFLPLWLSARLVPTLSILLIIIALYTGFRRWQDQLATAPLFIIAWISVLLAAVYTISMNYFGFGNITHAIYAMQIGFALQQILLSIGLAQQMNTLKAAKIRYEQESHLAKAESAAKSEFLARMSHEIRTPMNAVLGVTQLLQSSPLNTEQQQQVSLLYNSSKQLLELINDILDFSRMDANKLTLCAESFDLPALLSECVSLFTAVAQQKSLVLRYQQPADLPQWLEGDSLRIRQILLNLLGNAIKFTAEGEVCLTIDIVELRDDHCRLKFSIKDSGIGISNQQQALLFTAFSQADSSITRQYGGSGLGLAISQQLVELMGGSIAIASELGLGATFSFELDFKRVIAPAPLANTQPSSSQTTHLANLHILVAEDSPINQVVIRSMLQRLGITHVMVSNGQDALQTMMQQHSDFDVVLMDYEMPILDGVSTVKQLRIWEQQQQLRRLPVIALTAHALPHYVQLCRNAGMDDFLTKPIFLGALSTKLQQFNHS
ncbi:MAG: 7TM diverse intracellular signaling domain-containing protein [Agitococcus sp.]|nr:7TM diverse intracellular signaling domain-containing protein [Agitococcus sp.]